MSEVGAYQYALIALGKRKNQPHVAIAVEVVAEAFGKTVDRVNADVVVELNEQRQVDDIERYQLD